MMSRPRCGGHHNTRRSALQGEELLQHEVLEAAVVAQAGGENQGAAKALGIPREFLRLVLADDCDHLAHYGEANVAGGASADLDQLLRAPPHERVPAGESELAIVERHAVHFEHAAALCRVETERHLALR